MTVRFDDRHSLYSVNDLDELLPAWALTIHKSQGSEFPAVILPLYNGHYHMLRRKLLYTAVTRGRRLVILIGSKQALQKAVSDASENKRHSNLAHFLENGPPPINFTYDLQDDLWSNLP
jgi:exodeoxyribonuclease V alpha subunit